MLVQKRVQSFRCQLETDPPSINSPPHLHNQYAQMNTRLLETIMDSLLTTTILEKMCIVELSLEGRDTR